MEENLHYYLQRITQAQEEERKRILRDLHDEELQENLGDILTKHLGFRSIPCRGLVETILKDAILEENGIRSRMTEKLISEPKIFYGLNMMIAIETTYLTLFKKHTD